MCVSMFMSVSMSASVYVCLCVYLLCAYCIASAQVTAMLAARFTPQPSLLKKRLEDLIERAYVQLARVQRNSL